MVLPSLGLVHNRLYWLEPAANLPLLHWWPREGSWWWKSTDGWSTTADRSAVQNSATSSKTAIMHGNSKKQRSSWRSSLLKAWSLGNRNWYQAFHLSLIPICIFTPSLSKLPASRNRADLMHYSKDEHTGGAGRREKRRRKTRRGVNDKEQEPAPLWNLIDCSQLQLVQHNAHLWKLQKTDPCEHPLNSWSKYLSRSLALIIKHLSSGWGAEFCARKGKANRCINKLFSDCVPSTSGSEHKGEKSCTKEHNCAPQMDLTRRLQTHGRKRESSDRFFHCCFIRK